MKKLINKSNFYSLFHLVENFIRMKKNGLLFIVIVSILTSCTLFQKPSGVSVHDLRCEYLTNPIGIDVQLPRFSWKFIDPDHERGQRQTAYQIIVSQLADEEGAPNIKMWDSGKTKSPMSVNNEYKGAELKSNRKYYWKVRVWDKDGNPTTWSSESFFPWVLSHHPIGKGIGSVTKRLTISSTSGTGRHFP